jgi:lysophospholipase L1-like esterase
MENTPADRAAAGPDFAYSNLSTRPPARFISLARRVLPGVAKVENEIAPYAAAWHERNIAALGGTGPLWVVLGDSISQGIGASSVDRGWVPQARSLLHQNGIDYRVVNLSVSGARVADLIDQQIPAMNALAAVPDLVTVFTGSNDVIRKANRRALPQRFSQLLALLPRGSMIATVPAPRGVLAEVNALLDQAAPGRGLIKVVVQIPPGARAEDHFHPGDAGHAAIALAIAAAVRARHA